MRLTRVCGGVSIVQISLAQGCGMGGGEQGSYYVVVRFTFTESVPYHGRWYWWSYGGWDSHVYQVDGGRRLATTPTVPITS